MKWFDWLPKRHPPPIDDGTWHLALSLCPLAQRLSADEQGQLRQLCARFLQRKRFYPINTDLDATQRLLIALQACLPIRHMGMRALRGWQSVIVYPNEFRVRRDHHDNRTGVVTEQNQILAGEAWHLGPLVLSWAAVQHSLEQPWNGHNVVAHEIAHKLDMLNGRANGLPLLPRDISQKTWIDTFQRAYDGLILATHDGHFTTIDRYATTNPGEYFAVVSELHFSDPAGLAQAEPDVAALLETFYGPSPAPK